MPVWPHAAPVDFAQVLRTATRSTIAQAPDGVPVWLTGTVQAGPRGTVAGPFSGMPCAFFRTWFFPAEDRVVHLLTASEFSGDGYPAVGSRTHASDSQITFGIAVADTRSDVPFVVNDGTGTVLIDTTITQVQSKTVTVERRNTDAKAGPRGSLIEWVVAPGQPVAVLGALRTNPDGSRLLVPTPNHVAVVSTELEHLEAQQRYVQSIPVVDERVLGVSNTGNWAPGYWTPGTPGGLSSKTRTYLVAGVVGFVVLLFAATVIAVLVA